MEGVAAAKNLGEEGDETVTLIRKIGLMVDLSEWSERGGEPFPKVRERGMGGRRKRCHLLFGR